MAKEFTQNFYGKKEWKSCRDAYMAKVGGLCEECLKAGLIVPAEEVHHIIPLNENNISNDEITLNFANLRALCREHHRQAHSTHGPRRYIVDELERVTICE